MKILNNRYDFDTNILHKHTDFESLAHGFLCAKFLGVLQNISSDKLLEPGLAFVVNCDGFSSDDIRYAVRLFNLASKQIRIHAYDILKNNSIEVAVEFTIEVIDDRKEMSIEDIEKELGYKIKLVDKIT